MGEGKTLLKKGNRIYTYREGVVTIKEGQTGVVIEEWSKEWFMERDS